MGLDIELYFNGEDLKSLIEDDLKNVLIRVKTESKPDQLPIVIVTAVANYTNRNSKTIAGCPTPCHPNGSVDCEDQSEQLLQIYKDKNII